MHGCRDLGHLYKVLPRLTTFLNYLALKRLINATY